MVEEQAEAKWFKRFITLFFAGFIVIVLGIVFLTVAAFLSGAGDLSVGGFVWIFPFFPIVFGAGPEAHWLVLFAVILAVLGVIVFFVFWKTAWKGVFS
ncbi:MAG: hypothetical protein QW660_02730 [Candidatus Bathyarchaeia archaeon]